MDWYTEYTREKERRLSVEEEIKEYRDMQKYAFTIFQPYITGSPRNSFKGLLDLIDEILKIKNETINKERKENVFLTECIGKFMDSGNRGILDDAIRGRDTKLASRKNS